MIPFNRIPLHTFIRQLSSHQLQNGRAEWLDILCKFSGHKKVPSSKFSIDNRKMRRNNNLRESLDRRRTQATSVLPFKKTFVPILRNFPSDAPKSAQFTHDWEPLQKHGWAKLPLLSNCAPHLLNLRTAFSILSYLLAVEESRQP